MEEQEQRMSTATTPSRRRLAQATLAAVGTATVLLVVAILPAEYGVDPTGVGRALGLSKISERPVIVDANGTGPEVLYAFDLAWQVREETILQREGYLTPRDVQERVPFSFDGSNLTQMTAILRWEDDDRIDGEPTDPDVFEISLNGPDDVRSQYVSAANEEDGNGKIEGSVQWRSVPTPALDDSGRYLIDTKADDSAQGAWNALVRLYQAGGKDGEPDPGNKWNLTIRARTFGLTNLGTFGSNIAGDRVSLTLPPGGAVEYKFRMEEGNNLTYRWTSSAVVTFDFHGDEPGQEDTPTSHKQGAADRDSGTLVIPFDGRHGWWWYNSGTTQVTVTLETQGDYEILGVV